MRIRKNAKLSSFWFSSHASAPETFQAHVCQLNQSPWDVIPFSQDFQQVEGEDSFTGNASLADSIGAVESVASLMDGEDKAVVKAEPMVLDEDDLDENRRAFDDDNHEKQDNRIGYEKREGVLVCNKTDGKGWQCRKEAKGGHYLCEHHFNQLRSYSSNSTNSLHLNSIKKPMKATAAAAAAAAAGARRGRARKKVSGSSSNPYEFYYYSGFGPLWGKKRGDRGGEEKKSDSKGFENASQCATPSSSSQIDNEEFDYVDDDDEEDENGENGKKRMRKPVKARSLKSLM